MWNFLKQLFSRKLKIAHRVGQFMHDNPDLLVIVCDPKTDSIMTGYQNLITATAIKPDVHNRKTRSKVIKEVLSMSRIDHAVDRFLLQIDGAVWNIAKARRDKRAGKQMPSEVVPISQVKTLPPTGIIGQA